MRSVMSNPHPALPASLFQAVPAGRRAPRLNSAWRSLRMSGEVTELRESETLGSENRVQTTTR